MNKFVKSMLALGIAGAFGVTTVNAATYRVVDTGDVDSVRFTYSQKENNVGNSVLSGTDLYDFPVQYQYFDQDDFDNIERLAEVSHESVFGLNDLEDKAALEAGNPTANDLEWVLRYLQGQGSTYQKIGDIVALVNFNGETKELIIFDQPFEGTDTLTRSTLNFISGITNDNWVFGNASAPYLPVPFVDADDEDVTFWVREFTTRAYFSPDGGETIVPVIPPEATYGGESAILDMSDNHLAVGYASTSIGEGVQERIDDDTGGCADPDRLDDMPFEICIQNVANLQYNIESFKWEFDENGVVSSEVLGQLVTPHEDDDRAFVSVAQAINASGTAVGYSHGWIDENETEPSENEGRSLYAVVFKDGLVRDFTEDHGEFFDSRAYDINDNGIAVGDVKTFVNGNQRSKFYYVDTNDIDNMKMILPDGFFTGSSSTANAINENGIIVGSGEVETHNDSSTNPRRRHGFMYDTNNKIFTDLNDFLSCESEYTVIEATDINELNEISASAIVKVPRRDEKGELMLDDQGNQLVEDVVRAVKLVPTGGNIEDCSKVKEKVERKGAGIGAGLLLSLFGLSLFRRFRA